MTAAGDTRSSSAGDLALIPPATDHAIANDGDTELALRLGPVARRLGRRALGRQPGAQATGYDEDYEDD